MDIYWNIFTMHGPMNVKFPNNTSKWQMEFNSAFKGLMSRSRGISYMKYINGRRTGLVIFCVETAFYNGLLKERYKVG
jgi:hypothetical protein